MVTPGKPRASSEESEGSLAQIAHPLPLQVSFSEEVRLLENETGRFYLEVVENSATVLNLPFCAIANVSL